MLETSDKISIINALMQEDRNEIRLNKNILLSSTYFILSGVIAITAFYLSQDKSGFRSPILFGLWSLFFVYFLYFSYFMKHLAILRLYLDLRERYYKDLDTLENETPFNPLKLVSDEAKPSMTHKFLWALPLITFLVSMVNSIFILTLP